jgi:hypothetical protein
MQAQTTPLIPHFLAHSCDDIISGTKFSSIDVIDYDPVSLTDNMYKMLCDKKHRREVLKNNKFRGVYASIDKILHHVTVIDNNEAFSRILAPLFLQDQRHNVTPVDLVFLNCNYNKLVRAKIEAELLSTPIVNGSIITGYQNTETDYTLAQCLLLFRIVCRYLGMKSTVDTTTFSIDKLKNTRFWASVTNKFLTVFGEEVVDPVEEIEIPIKPALETLLIENEIEQRCIMKSLIFLNEVFGKWSGTYFTRKGDVVQVTPAIYIAKLLPIMQKLTHA